MGIFDLVFLRWGVQYAFCSCVVIVGIRTGNALFARCLARKVVGDGMFLEWNYFPFYPQRLSGSGSASLTGFVYHRFHKNLVPSMGMDFTPELFAQNMCRFYRLGFDYVFHETIIYTLICRKDVAAETILDLINNNAALILSHGRVGHRIVTDYLPIHVWKYLSDCLIDENLRNILL